MTSYVSYEDFQEMDYEDFLELPNAVHHQRSKWVNEYNDSLLPVKWYDAEFECEMSIATGGIYDSEYMNFVYDGLESPRIKYLIEKVKPIWW
jgi:hypothetical protein